MEDCFINQYNFYCFVSGSQKKKAEPTFFSLMMLMNPTTATMYATGKGTSEYHWIFESINKIIMHVLTLLILIVKDHHHVWERRLFTPHKMLLALNSMCIHADISSNKSGFTHSHCTHWALTGYPPLLFATG